VPATRPALIAFLIGLLYPLYTITGFDASAHTSEETHNARLAVPRGMIHAVLWSLIFGLAMAISFVLASPDLAVTAKDGANAWFNLFNNLPAPSPLKAVVAIAIVVANYICALAGLTSTSRMIFAFARDGGLPASSVWRHVSPGFRTPVAAIWLGAVLSVAATLYSPAFAALAAGCALFLYISYAMPIAAGLFTEGKSWTEFGPFRLGIWSKPFAVVTVLGVLVLMYAGIQPPFDILINYAIGLVVLLVILWFGIERRRFKGPPIGVEIAKRQAEIAAAEKAVGETG
jgi:amino acid transporter